MKKETYFNTTGLSGEQLGLFEAKADSQDVIILEIYRRFNSLTASECYKLFPDRTTPLTSIRRSITNLFNSGKLVKTEHKKPGIYGRPEYIYRIF